MQAVYYDDIDNIYWQINSEQPGTTSAIAGEWLSFGLKLAIVSGDIKDVTEALSDWESPEAKEAYRSRADESTEYLDEAAETAWTIGLRLVDLSEVMTEGQERMQELYDEYRADMEVFDGKEEYEQGDMLDAIRAETGVAYVADGTYRGMYKAHWSVRAKELSHDIASTYNEPNTSLYYAAFPGMVPLDYIFHPGGMGMPFTLPGGPGAPAPPPAAPAPVAPPAPPPAAPAPVAPPQLLTAPPAPPPGTTAPAQAPPAPPQVQTAPPAPPPGTTAPTQAPPAPPPAFSPGPAPAVIAPSGLFAPPPGTPGGSVISPPGAAKLSGPAGSPLPPGAQTLGIESLPPGVLGAESAAPPPPGAVDPNGPPGATIGDPGSPGAGVGLPPGMGGMGMPPGMGMGTPPPPANAAKKGSKGSTPPGTGTSVPGAPDPTAAARSGLQTPPGTGMGMPPGGMMPPGAGAGAPPPGSPAARSGRATTPPAGGIAAPGTNVPEAFLPPTGFGPPVLGDPQRQRARPGGPAEAPLAFRSMRGGPSIGGGTPPILANRHQTGPRQTHTERRAAERVAHRERMKRFREMLTSVFAKDLPDGTAPVLEGRPAGADGSAGARVVEIPPALRALQRAIERNRQRRPGQPADRATRRPVTEQQTAPATSAQPGTAWEVENPGGPVVAGDQRRRQRRDSGSGSLGSGS
jgi:hypothetical protein